MKEITIDASKISEVHIEKDGQFIGVLYLRNYVRLDLNKDEVTRKRNEHDYPGGSKFLKGFFSVAFNYKEPKKD